MLIEVRKKEYFDTLLAARNCYTEMQFKRARSLRDSYIIKDRPQVFAELDKQRAEERSCRLSVIVVAFNSGPGLLKCLDAILEQGSSVQTEVILVDNGGNDGIAGEILSRDIDYVKLPVNVGPSEARNIGADFASGEILVFIDDDGVIAEDCLLSIVDGFDKFNFSAIRGRVVPLEMPENCLPGHYDLGLFPIPAVLETEGSMAVRSEVWERTGGMDPMLFGAEGVEFSERIFSAFPDSDIYYWPGFCLKHDYAVGPGVERKIARHKTAAKYFSEYSKAAKHIPVQYGLWYQARPAGSIRYDQRTLSQKITAALKEIFLRRKSLPRQAEKDDAGERAGLAVPLNVYSKDMLLQRMQEAERRGDLLEQNLQTIIDSPAYRLGRSLAECLKSPLRGALRFPVEFAAIVRDVFRPRKKVKTEVTVVGEAETDYTNPGREEHRCRLFEPAAVTVDKPRSELRIGTILPNDMLEAFMFEGECGIPDVEDLQKWFEEFKPDLVIGTQVYDGRRELLDAVFQECSVRNIPSVFWFTGDVAAFADFKKTALRADRCYAGCPELATHIAGIRECGLLPPAVQPSLHNPLTLQDDRTYEVKDAVCFDGWADFIEFPGHWDEILSVLNDSPVHIFESRWSLMANKLNDLPGWKPFIHGCIRPDEMRSVLKTYKVLVQGDKTLSSNFSRASSALQAIVSGAYVVSLESDNLLEKSGIATEAYRSVPEAGALKSCVDESLNDPQREQVIQRERRDIYDNHSYAARLKQICRDLGVGFEAGDNPACALITPTKRPHMLKQCLETHRTQSYAGIKSIVVLNNTECNVDEVRSLCDEYGATLLVMPEEKTIGECLNEGIRHAGNSIWFKIDDDDFYGNNYVKDIVHAWMMSGADLFGKAAGYIYFENDDSLWRRAVSRVRPHFLCKKNTPHMSGATFAGSNLFFSSMHRACVDSLFFEQALRDGCLIHMTDHFNFVAFRGADKSRHTWRQGDSELQKNADYVGDRNAIAKVML